MLSSTTRLTINNNGTKAALPSVLTLPQRAETEWEEYNLTSNSKEDWVGYSDSQWTIKENTLASRSPKEGTQTGPTGKDNNNVAFSCQTIKQSYPTSSSGTYWVHLGSSIPREVYCDMESDGGGWLLVLADTGRNEIYGLPREYPTLQRRGRIELPKDLPDGSRVKFDIYHPNAPRYSAIHDAEDGADVLLERFHDHLRERPEQNSGIAFPDTGGQFVFWPLKANA